jgi:endo-1,4-beta-xylanase
MKKMLKSRGGDRIWQLLHVFLVMSFVQVYAGPIQTNVPHLKDVYANDFYIGCLLSYAHIGFSTDPPVPDQGAISDTNGGYLIQYHMNSMSPGNWMKAQNTVDLAACSTAYAAAAAQAQKDSINIHPAVRFQGRMIAQLNWAQRQGFTFRGHTLVWHSQTPGTGFFRTGYASNGTYLRKDSMTMRMDNYIREIFRLLHQSWPGLLSAMDVVNEAIDDATGKLRTSGNEWWIVYQDSSYIMAAFQSARQHTIEFGETQTKLYYNDYNTENSTKADGIVGLLTPIFQAGYLDGIGMQEHDNNSTPTALAFITSYNKFYPICSEMAVTEFDVSTQSGTNYPSSAILTTQANQYGQLFKCFVERSFKSGRGKIINVSKDGLNDQYTFVTNQSSSLWNTRDTCKPSFFAAANVGIHYNALDSLISCTDTLQQANYTPESWSHFTSILAQSITVRDQNYSNSISADTALGIAGDSLQAAIAGLVRIGTGVNIVDNVPKSFALSQNYPNPFNPTTRINYSVPVKSYISLKIYNLIGEEVAMLFEGVREAGNYTATFDGNGLASGVYFYRLQANNFVDTKKFILMK